jgi:hypothetical protein
MFVVTTFAHNLVCAPNLNKEKMSCIRQATWIANLFQIKQNIKFYGFLVFWVAYKDIFIESLS